MSWFSQVMDPLLGGDHSEARKVAKTLSDIGHPAAALADDLIEKFIAHPISEVSKGLGLPGTKGGGNRGGTRPQRPMGHPKPHYMTNPKRNYAPNGAALECVDGAEEFTFASRLQLSGAQATGTDLGDFLTTAASSDIVVNNAFPFNFDADEAALFLSTNANNAVGSMVETVAVVSSLKFIERKFNAQEQYQFGVLEFAPLYSSEGNAGTPTATAPARGATIFDVSPDQQYVSWKRHYEINQQWQMVLRTPRAFTPAGLVDLTLNLRGVRS